MQYRTAAGGEAIEKSKSVGSLRILTGRQQYLPFGFAGGGVFRGVLCRQCIELRNRFRRFSRALQEIGKSYKTGGVATLACQSVPVLRFFLLHRPIRRSMPEKESPRNSSGFRARIA